jgi:hypothetical protein
MKIQAPWSNDLNKTVHYEFQFKNKTVRPGMIVKLKRDSTQYKFICYVHDTKLDSTWIELISVNGYKATRIENISKVLVTKKKSRAKKE